MQFTQSPRSSAVTSGCAPTYSNDGNCYPPGAEAQRLRVDLALQLQPTRRTEDLASWHVLAWLSLGAFFLQAGCKIAITLIDHWMNARRPPTFLILTKDRTRLGAL